MSPKSLLALLALAAIVALAGYVHFQRDVTEALVADSLDTPATPPAPTDDAGESLPSAESVVNKPDTNEAESPKEYARNLLGQLEEAEIVYGRKVKKNRNCTYHITGYTTYEDGTTTPITKCVPNEPEPVDIYRSYSNAELETLAYSDSHAAYNLTLRLRERDYPRAINYALRSAALTGDIKGIAVMTVYIPHSARVDNKINLKYLEEQYVLTGVAQAVDNSSTAFNRVSRETLAYQGNGIDINALDARIADHLATIEEIRNEVGID